MKKKNPGMTIDNRKTHKKQILYLQSSQERDPKFQKKC